MSALPKLDHGSSISRRDVVRRKLHLEVQASGGLGNFEVAVLDLSTTGLLIKTTDAWRVGEAIELDLPGTGAMNATVKWASGSFFGCEFHRPISKAAISAALLQAAPAPPRLADSSQFPDEIGEE